MLTKARNSCQCSTRSKRTLKHKRSKFTDATYRDRGVCLHVYTPGVCFPHGNSDTTDPVRGFHVAVLHCLLQLIVKPQHQRYQVHQSISISAHACNSTQTEHTRNSLCVLTSGSQAVRWPWLSSPRQCRTALGSTERWNSPGPARSSPLMVRPCPPSWTGSEAPSPSPDWQSPGFGGADAAWNTPHPTPRPEPPAAGCDGAEATGCFGTPLEEQWGAPAEQGSVTGGPELSPNHHHNQPPEVERPWPYLPRAGTRPAGLG